MALKIAFENTVTYVNPVDSSDEISKTNIHPVAYVMVSDIHGTKEWLTADVVIYADETKEKAVSRKSYSFVPSTGDGSDNFIRQAYLHIKSLDEFTGAEDC